MPLPTKPLTQEAYQKFGDVIAPREDIEPILVNRGTAKRFNHVTRLENLRPATAKPNLCLFSCQPIQTSLIEIKVLERHPFSTQVLIPIKGSARYLAIVCLGKEEPDLKTLKVFVVRDSQGITYKPGVWHHPICVLDQPTDFACLVWEAGTEEDCETKTLTTPISLSL